MPGGYVEINVTSDGRVTVRSGAMPQRPRVKMTRRQAVTAALATCVLIAVQSLARADEKETQQALEKLGAELTHVGLDASKPIFWVDFSKNSKFTDKDLKEAVGHLKQLPEFHRLTLASTKVTDEGLAQLKELKGLKELILVQTKVTDKGLKHLQGMSQLTEVNIIMTKVTEQGVNDLKKALPKAEIIHKIGTNK
jgi:hypothetical protein